MNNYSKAIFLLIVLFCVCSCTENADSLCEDLPTDYTTFSPVSYTGQTERLDMLDEWVTYMKQGNNGTVLNADIMQAMFENTGSVFSTTYEKNLVDKCFEPQVAAVQARIQQLANASASAGQEGSNGTAGLVSNADASKTYLFDENGFEYLQLIEKGLMGSVFYYQATAVYLSDSKIGESVDNTNSDPVKGTDMEHHWDEAFGYFGVPQDFPTNIDGIRYWGKYCNSRDELLQTNTSLMNALLLGRCGISNQETDTKNTGVADVRAAWELVVASTAIHYLNSAFNNLSDDGTRNHALSEAIAFIEALQYNPETKTDSNTVTNLIATIGDNLYEVNSSSIMQVRDTLADIYNLNDTKNQL